MLLLNPERAGLYERSAMMSSVNSFRLCEITLVVRRGAFWKDLRDLIINKMLVKESRATSSVVLEHLDAMCQNFESGGHLHGLL